MRSLTIGALALCIASSAAATLQARDMNNDGSIDAFYDSSLNITWLADAHYARTQRHPPDNQIQVDGSMPAGDASYWATHLVVDGVAGWRLPTGDTGVPVSCTVFPGGNVLLSPGTGCTFTPLTTVGNGEITDLLFNTLGNTPGSSLSNVGPFLNLAGLFLTSSIYTGPYATGPVNIYANTTIGKTFAFYGTDGWAYAWAVHDGDVAAVPEPSTYALLLSGIVALAFVARRTRRTRFAV